MTTENKQWDEETRQKMDRVLGLSEAACERMHAVCMEVGLNEVQFGIMVEGLRAMVSTVQLCAALFGLHPMDYMKMLNIYIKDAGDLGKLCKELGIDIADLQKYKESQQSKE